MRRKMAAILLTAAVTASVPWLTFAQSSLPAVATTQPVAADVPVKEVVLFSSGVGYFEHFGTIKGDGSTELRFKTNQINDILKSLLLQDMDGGKVTTITYPSQDPIVKTLKSFQVDITANPPMADLLNQLRGAKVTATINGEKITGVILGVEKKRVIVKNEKTDDQTAWQPVLNLVSDGKIISQPLDAMNSIELDDPVLQDELNKALLALAGARDQDKKPVKINFTGQGERRVRLGYVVEIPVWKTSYRLILGTSKEAGPTTQPGVGDGNLQGWAIVENQTDNDWNNVQLSLVSGRPISFIEDLYQPLYVPRPVVKPELYASLSPQTYAAGQSDLNSDAEEFGIKREAAKSLPAAQPQAAALAPKSPNYFFGDHPLPAEQPINPNASIASIASATKAGELFQYTVGNVSLPRQRSAMIPIITDPIEVEKLSIYNASIMPRNPLNGARVKNTTTKHLLAGPITVLDGSTYAGDAQIDNLPPGQERLLSYGVDLEMLVDSTDNRTDTQLQTGRIVKGVLYLSRKIIQTQDYVAENKSDHVKTLIIEHARLANWELVNTDKPVETTDTLYRFKGKVESGKKSKLTVSQQIVQEETAAILTTDFSALEFYSKAGEIPKAVKDALGEAMAMKQAVVDTQRELAEAKQKLSDITTEQNRIRDNMRAVDATSQYRTRLLTKLNDQETQIEKTQGLADDLQKKATDQQNALEAYLQDLNVG